MVVCTVWHPPLKYVCGSSCVACDIQRGFCKTQTTDEFHSPDPLLLCKTPVTFCFNVDLFLERIFQIDFILFWSDKKNNEISFLFNICSVERAEKDLLFLLFIVRKGTTSKRPLATLETRSSARGHWHKKKTFVKWNTSLKSQTFCVVRGATLSGSHWFFGFIILPSPSSLISYINQWEKHHVFSLANIYRIYSCIQWTPLTS